MSLARRLMAATAMSRGGTSGGQQAEFTVPGQNFFRVPDGVTSISGVAVSPGEWGMNISPFHGGKGGNLHWRNAIPVTPGEVLNIQVGNGQRGTTTALFATWLRRGASEYLLRTGAGSTLYHPSLGGGGAVGGARGSGTDGNGGLGGGAAGYTGTGGKGGNYQGTTNGGLPAPLSGGGRGGDSNGIPYGYQGYIGEGVGLQGLSADKSTSVGPKIHGGGGWANTSGGQPGGVRIMWGDDVRSYPNNAIDVPRSTPAAFIGSTRGSGAAPLTFTLPPGVQPNDIVILQVTGLTTGSFAGVSGGAGNWNTDVGVFYYKQIEAADIAATLQITGSGTFDWRVLVYRGGTRIVQRSSAVFLANPFVIPGFNKRVDSKRILAKCQNNAGNVAIGTPAGFTKREEKTTPLRFILADIDPAAYTDGAPVSFSNISTDDVATGWLFEIY